MTTPLIDIVIVTNSQAAWLDLAIRGVEHHTRNSYRLTIVASGVTDPKVRKTIDEAARRGHTTIDLAENRSFSDGVNAGVRVGSAKFVIILNDDAIPTESWDAALIQDAGPREIGLVGARSNYVAGAQGNPLFKGEPPYIVFVCAALRREVWDTVGPMDSETFDGWSGEDVDYSWRVRKAGYKLKVSSAYVLHAGSRSIAQAHQSIEARNRNNQKYNARLEEKWGREWVENNSKFEGRGLVVSYHAEDWTRVQFMESLMGLRRSDNVGFSYLHVRRAPIHIAREQAANYAVDQGYDWFVQFDDDATFPSDVLRRLLAHQKDVVCAIAYQRKPPHHPCIFELGPNGELGAPLEGIEHTGLRRVDVSGFHCSIMRTSVIKRLREAGIKQYFGGFENRLGEDFAFCLNLKKIGVQVYADTELISGHIGESTVVDEAYRAAWKAQQK